MVGLSNHAVVVPSGAKTVYEDMVHQSVRWRTYVQTLPGTSSRAPLFVEDLFYALYVSEIELNGAVRPSLYWNFAVLAALLPMPDFARLRRETVGDAIASAMAVRRLAPELFSVIEGEGEGDEGAGNNGLLHVLARAMVGRFGRGRRRQGEGQRAGQLQRQRTDVDAPRGKAAEESRSEEGIDPAAVRVLGRVLEETVWDTRLRRAWGIEPGVRSAHVLDDVWELVEQVRQLPGFEQLTDTLMEMNATLQPAAKGRGRRRGTSPRFEQLLGWTRGRDVERVVPEEWVRLLDDDMAMMFYEAYEYGRLVQERYGAKGPDGPGPLVVCLDVSRSMNTVAAGGRERFVWAKGLGLALMDAARRTGRSFLGICFSSEADVALFEVGPGEYEPRVAIDLARCDFDGGTHFQAPLREAITYLERVKNGAGDSAGSARPASSARDVRGMHGRSGPGHIVFVTDGEAALPAPFVRYVAEARRKIGFQLVTMFIDGGQEELEQMSDRVFRVEGGRISSWERTVAGLARVLA